MPSYASDAKSTSASEWGNIAHFAPESHKSNNSIENIAIPDVYLHNAFIVQNDNSISEVWTADSGASCHMMHDKRLLKVECVGNVELNSMGTQTCA